MSLVRYAPPPAGTGSPVYLVADPGTPGERRFAFSDSIEIGRDDANRSTVPGQLLIQCPTVSHRHCIVIRRENGRCFVRDLSRNGTRIDGRRLVPNVEVEIQTGQTIEVAPEFRFRLEAPVAATAGAAQAPEGRTMAISGVTVATVLVGDIRDYTVLVRRAPSAELQQSVGRVFELLSEEVVRMGGTVKEYQGDAIFAFWEGSFDGRQAVSACNAAIALNQAARRLAVDPAVWRVKDFPLTLDWALATGPVMIDSLGTVQRAGLSMIGEAVVLAFRIEKFAGDDTGPIVTCSTTRQMAGNHFTFRDLGEKLAKGFERPDRVFALDAGPEPDSVTLAPGRVR